MNDAVVYELRQGVATITLNRPEARNALNDAIVNGLRAAFDRAAADHAVRAVLLTGAGKGFCAGADLTQFNDRITPESVTQYLQDNYLPLMTAIATLPKPVVAAINGIAAGAGASLALACDMRIMADDAALMQAFSNIGLVPDGGSSWYLVRMVGYGRAFEIAAEGERIIAQRCVDFGLANAVAPSAELAAVAFQRAAQLAQRPTAALGWTKQALYHALQTDLAGAIMFEAQLQSQAISSRDHREGIAAFRERRSPSFSGH
ncbi:MAG: enoyl-CoA hydratase-related protein [Herpetosiphon sp.]